MRTTLNGVAKPWVVFVEAIVARENLPSWDRIWNDFVEEETQRGIVKGISSTSGEDEQNVALTTKGKKKFKKGPKKGGAKQYDGKRKDLSTIKCFACQKLGNYVGQCPHTKKKKQEQTTTSAEVEEFTTRFEREFSLCVGHVERERESIITSTDIEIEGVLIVDRPFIQCIHHQHVVY